MRWYRFHIALIGALVAALLTVGVSSSASYPQSMASTGDSITRAYNAGWLPYTDYTAGSWSTGSDTRVVSHRQRIEALSPSGKLVAYNDARSGARMADLNRQMQAAATQEVDYVTVLMGANDVCTSSEATMTTVADFTTQFTTAMDTITTALPSVTVYVVSIPDIYHLWKLYKGSFIARSVWSTAKICQSMLANAGSTATADEARRGRVRQRNIDFNGVLAAVCATYRQCRFDNNAVFDTAFARSDVSARDYFHPSLSGQAKLAAVSWSNGPWGP
jgi:lysophospholipase L1-like esterase